MEPVFLGRRRGLRLGFLHDLAGAFHRARETQLLCPAHQVAIGTINRDTVRAGIQLNRAM